MKSTSAFSKEEWKKWQGQGWTRKVGRSPDEDTGGLKGLSGKEDYVCPPSSFVDRDKLAVYEWKREVGERRLRADLGPVPGKPEVEDFYDRFAVLEWERELRVRRQGRETTPEWLEVPLFDQHKYSGLSYLGGRYVALKEHTISAFDWEMTDEESLGDDEADRVESELKEKDKIVGGAWTDEAEALGVGSCGLFAGASKEDLVIGAGGEERRGEPLVDSEI